MMKRLVKSEIMQIFTRFFAAATPAIAANAATAASTATAADNRDFVCIQFKGIVHTIYVVVDFCSELLI